MKLFLLFALLVTSINAKGCPFCNTNTAREIRASLFGPEFLFNLSATILPFVIFTLIIYLISRGGSRKMSVETQKNEENE